MARNICPLAVTGLPMEECIGEDCAWWFRRESDTGEPERGRCIVFYAVDALAVITSWLGEIQRTMPPPVA